VHTDLRILLHTFDFISIYSVTMCVHGMFAYDEEKVNLVNLTVREQVEGKIFMILLIV